MLAQIFSRGGWFRRAPARDDASLTFIIPSYLRGHRGAVFGSGGDRLSQGIEAARAGGECVRSINDGARGKRSDSGGDEIATGERGRRDADSVFGRDGVAHCAAARARRRFLELGFAGCRCGSDGLCRDVWDSSVAEPDGRSSRILAGPVFFSGNRRVDRRNWRRARVAARRNRRRAEAGAAFVENVFCAVHRVSVSLLGKSANFSRLPADNWNAECTDRASAAADGFLADSGSNVGEE